MTYSDKLKELVYSNKKCVSVRDVAHQFNVHVSEARRILEDFLAEHKEDKKLSGVYVVSGTSKDSCDSYKSYKLAYAEANELEEIKKNFATVDSCSLFSVAEKDVEPVIEDVDQPPILDIADISKYQKLTYILNDDIKLREDRVEKMKLILGLQKNNEEPKVKEVKKENVTELAKPKKELINGSNKKSTNNKNKNNKKQTKLAGFDSKKVKTEKPEPEPEPMVDPFSEEEEAEEDKEEKIEKVEKVEEKEKEPEIVKKERSPSPPPSPPVIKDEPMEEEPVQKVSKSKKRKRVRVFDSDEEDEETIALKILADSPTDDDKPVKKSKKGSKPSQPMETRTISEEYTDEDGYTQVKLVKKLVPVKKDDDEENVNSNKSTKVKTEKSVDKKKKAEVETEDEESKPKPKKLSKAAAAKKGQVSITNFFKPTAKD